MFTNPNAVEAWLQVHTREAVKILEANCVQATLDVIELAANPPAVKLQRIADAKALLECADVSQTTLDAVCAELVAKTPTEPIIAEPIKK